MSTASLTLGIQTDILRGETLTNQITDNSQDLRLDQKYASNEIDKIQAEYAPKKEEVRSEIESLDDTSSSMEYTDLMHELNELKDEEEKKIEQVEELIHQKEEDTQLENDQLQTELEAVNADREAKEEMRSENIKNDYDYAG